MPKLMNPNYVPPALPIDAAKTQIDAWFAANDGVESVTFDQLRNYFKNNGFPNAGEWSDGQIDQCLREWGYSVVND